MSRTISKSMSYILEELELDNVTYIDMNMLNTLIEKYNIGTEAAVVAYRLKEAGWLIPTSQRGVWEFAPASSAGAYSRNDPLADIKAFLISNPTEECYLCLQTAAWAMNLADRIPLHKEVAFATLPQRRISSNLKVYRYKPVLEPINIRGVNCLSPESIVVQIAAKPSIIRSWESTMEWLPDVVYEMEIDRLLVELSTRTDSVRRRTGYLLQGMYPYAAQAVYNQLDSKYKVRFGPRTKAVRNDEKWQIVDTVLPFNTKELSKVK